MIIIKQDVGEVVGKNLCTLLSGMQISIAAMANAMKILQKLKLELPYYPATPLQGLYEISITDFWMAMFITA